jgi:hypothetical protein
MWYTGQRFESGHGWVIGYAESDDGFSWTRRDEPVLGLGTGWDQSLVYFPKVIVEGSTHHMWYTANSGSTEAIGYAVSPDGLEWTRYLGSPVVDGTSQFVLPNDEHGGFDMWYAGRQFLQFNLATSSCCSTIHTSFIPAAAHTEGLEGSHYTTDMDVSNAGSTAADYRFVWFPRGEDNSEWIYSDFFTLGAGMSVRYSNVLEEVFGLGLGAVGGLGMESSSPELLAATRIANHAADGGAGTFGQAMPTVTEEIFIRGSERRRIVFGTETDAMRTNIGCQNLTGGIAALKIEPYAADGVSLGVETMVLRPWSNDQINRVFRGHQPMTGAVDVWTASGDGIAFFCYGSVLDNVTNDPMTVLPQ